MTKSSLITLESDILRTRERLHENLSAIAARLEPARVAHRAREAVMRRLATLARSKPAAAALMALGLGLLLGTRDGRALARRKTLGAVGVTLWGAVMAAILRPERRRVEALPYD